MAAKYRADVSKAYRRGFNSAAVPGASNPFNFREPHFDEQDIEISELCAASWADGRLDGLTAARLERNRRPAVLPRSVIIVGVLIVIALPVFIIWYRGIYA